MTEHLVDQRRLLPETRRAIVKWVVQSVLGVIGYGAILFGSAGNLRWLWGWVMLALMGAFIATQTLTLIALDPDLLVERGKGIRAKGTKQWDRWIAVLAGGVFPTLAWVVAGLGVRFGWPGTMSLAVHLTGVLLYLLGMALFNWAMGSNAFFTEGVRIQPERDHTVATTGPYRMVRHPGYTGAILSVLTMPLILGSVWAAIPSLMSAGLYVVRTALEDRTLMEELPGYRAFASNTQFRLFPGIW